MRRKLYLSFFLFFFWGVGVWQVKSQTTMTLNFQDGTVKNSSLDAVSKITFLESNLFMAYVNGSNDSFMLNSIRKITFGTLSATTNILADEQKMSVYPNPASDFIALKNVPEGTLNAVVYRMDGAQIINVQLSFSSDKIDVSGLSQGLYIIKVNNKALKFTKL